MARALHAHDWALTTWRLLTPLLALLLVISVEAAIPASVEAGGGSTTSAIRSRQARVEATMLRADKQIKQLQKQRQKGAKHLAKAKRKLDQMIDRRNRGRARSGRVEDRLSVARQILGRALRVHPNPSGVQIADKPALRKRVRKLDRRHDRTERKVRKVERKVERARNRKQQRLRKVSRARIQARKAARERAEDRLGTQISQMLSLSKQRASRGPAAGGPRGFRVPVKGTVTQGYGCTGYGANGRRGGCRQFHDGIDIASARGARVRASANGYVAYVGRNPWDAGKRAYVVIIGHARGYETIYGHLKPIRKVKAGQRVKRGQVVGYMGNTGRSTGPHVHWEVSRDFRTLNPRRAGR